MGPPPRSPVRVTTPDSYSVLTLRRVRSTALAVGLSTTLFAQSPWERAASNLEMSFTGPLARSLAFVAIALGGLMFMFGERRSEAAD